MQAAYCFEAKGAAAASCSLSREGSVPALACWPMVRYDALEPPELAAAVSRWK
jgi:hypothetical protein